LPPIALLVAPDGHLLASSYPASYPAGISISALLPVQSRAISQALAGQASNGTEYFSSTKFGYAAEPVWSKDKQPIGALFLQAPGPDRGNVLAVLRGVLMINLVLLMLVTPVGVFFGWITTRGLVRRVQRLVLATTQFADGDYAQRVTARQKDEIGQLEQQFNRMAEQLVENISRRQQLAEQNARLTERSRISRELHDAISQDLFSLRLLADGLQEATRSGLSSADLRPHIAILEQTTSSMTREMRALLLELRPTQLEDLGLLGALKNLAHAYSTRLGITVTADLQSIPANVKGEHALLRIAQEGLANAARHSSATLISLCLASRTKLVDLTITDNGEGFDVAACEERHGLGLQLMQERVQELGGTFTLKTAPGQGTCILISLPWEDKYD
jgi:signal transduction histidine kinase